MKLILPNALMFGYGGSAPFPFLMILAQSHKDNKALIAHEECHQQQQRRDGLLAFWWKYLTSKPARLAYEVEAYKVWLKVAPLDIHKVVNWLTDNYGLDLTHKQAYKLLTE